MVQAARDGDGSSSIQVCNANGPLKEFRDLYNESPNDWSRQTKQDYSDLTFVRNGYVSKYNSLVADYNARRASFIRSFGRDSRLPEEYRTYDDSLCAGKTA